MKGLVDPPRLRDAGDSPADLVRALELSRADLPAASDLGAIASSLAAALPGAGLAQGSSRLEGPGSVRPVATGGATGIKVVVAAVVVAAIGAGGVAWQIAADRTHSASAPATTRPVEPLQGQRALRIPRGTSKRGGAKPVAPGAFASPAPTVSVADAPPEPPVRASARSANVPPTHPAGATRAGGSLAGSPIPAASSSAELEQGLTEIVLLNRAQQALRSDPTRTLELVAEHERRFSNGTLVQEREFIAIQALLGLNRSSAAAARARRFRSRFPDSAHLRRLDLLFGDADDDPTP